jgi:hypothetical protein
MCPVSSFWTSANLGASVLQTNTTGDTQVPDPTRFPGSSVGAVPSGYTSAARAVYPVFDGVTLVGTTRQSLAIDPRTGEVDFSRYPATFWSNLDVDNPPASVASLTLRAPTNAPDFSEPPDFTNWHSAFQAEYIAIRSERTLPTAITPPTYVIGASLTNASAIYMLDDKNRPVNLLAMTLSDYAMLTDTEKARFGPNLIDSGHLGRLGLSTSAGDRATVLAFLDGIISDVNNSSLSTAQRLLFTRQLDMLRAEVSPTTQAFSAAKIQTEANEIKSRFEVMAEFVSAPQSTAITFTNYISSDRGPFRDWDTSLTSASNLTRGTVNSLDGGASIRAAITAFERAETEILNAKQRRGLIVQNSAFRDPNLDVPNLIFQLQLLYEGEAEGVVDAGTEEFRQLHRLLEDYNVMQQMLSTTLAAFDTSKNDDKRRFMNIGGKEDGGVDDSQVDRFETVTATDIGYEQEHYEQYSNGTPRVRNDDTVPFYHWSMLAIEDNDVSEMYRRWTEQIRGDDAGDTTGKLTATQMLAFSMFLDEAWAKQGDRWHPIENLYNADRPTFDLIDESDDGALSLKLMGKNSYDQFQTALSNSITILNQQNQIKQNEVENATKQQNRHFELGNNALRKMNDLLLMIGRG